nr:hypothetical protein 2 [Gammaproteobacteria bacterium]
MKSSRECLLLVLVLSFQTAEGASFVCETATSEVEKMVCANKDLSRLDERVDKYYGEAMEVAVNPNEIRTTQRAWLRSRNNCKTEECVSNAYERRIKELRPFHASIIEKGEELVDEYVKDRAHELREVLKDKPLYLILPRYKNNPLCVAFRDDFKAQRDVELIPPSIRAHDFSVLTSALDTDGCRYESEPFGRAAITGTKDYLAYRMNLDNDRSLKTVIVGEYFEVSKYIKEEGRDSVIVLPRNVYMAADQTCKVSSLGRVGNIDHAEVNAMLRRDAPELAIHGIVRYKGEYFVYEVNDIGKMTPLSIRSLQIKDGKLTADTVCAYDHRRPEEFGDLETRLKAYEEKLRRPTVIGTLNLGVSLGVVRAETQLVGNICKLRLLRNDGSVLQTIDLPKNNWCPNSELFATFDANEDGYEDFVTVSGLGAGPFPYTSAWIFSQKLQQFVDDGEFPGGWPMSKTCTLVQARTGTGNGHVYTEVKWCFNDGEWQSVE